MRIYEPSPPAEARGRRGPRADGRPRPRRSTASPRRWRPASRCSCTASPGAGKTEVFLHAIARCLETGRGAIVLVPEIALAPQTGGSHHGPLRRSRGGAALGAGAGRPRGRAPAHPPRRGARGRRPALGDLRAARRDRADRGRRGARRRPTSRSPTRATTRAPWRCCARARTARRSSTPRPRRGPSRGTPWRACRLPERVGGRLPPVTIVDLCRDGGYPLSRPLSRRTGGHRARRRAGRAAAQPPRRGAGAALPRPAARPSPAATATSR